MRHVEFEQGKDRDGRPTWAVFIADVQVGRVKWWSTYTEFAFTPDPGPMLRSWALRDIADFLERRNREVQ